MTMLTLLTALAACLPQDHEPQLSLRVALTLEQPASGARRVLAWRLRPRGDGVETFGKLDFFARSPDVRATLGDASAGSIDMALGEYAVFAFVDTDGDGEWTPAVPEACAWASRVSVAPGDGEPLELQLRAPTHLPKSERVVDHGALRWRKGYPVVQLHGNAQQRGFAHGQLLAAQIVDVFRCYVLEDRLGSAAAYREFEAFLQSAFTWPPQFLLEIDAMLAGMRASGVDLAVPELGRDFGRTELLAINAYIETRAMRSSCTQFAAWGERTTGSEVKGGTIAARNMDGEIDLRRVTVSHFVLFAVSPSEAGHKRYVSMMWPGFIGTLSGFNEAGVHCMENAGGTGPGPVVTGLQPISWTMRQALATFDANSTPADFEALLALHANSAGGACGPGCIVLFALPSAAKQPAWVLEGDRFGHATRLPRQVPPVLHGFVMLSNHHLAYGVDAARSGFSFGREPSFSSRWRYEAGRHKVEGWARTGRTIGTAEMRELLQTVAHGTTEHSVITRPDLREFDVAVASMQAEPWDAPYRPWTTFAFEEVFEGSGDR